MKKQNIPVGISAFSEIRRNGYYYVDKSGLISELLETEAVKVTLITRPRRFGKTLAMNMLADFLDIEKDSRILFEGLEISEKTELCEKWMNRCPTIFLSFKDVDGRNFESAKGMLRSRIAELYNRHASLADSLRVNENDRKIFRELADVVDGSPTDDMLKTAVSLLMRMMRDHYGKRVVFLLDEYDVPLAKASSGGYYEEMLEMMKALLGTALKDNDALQLAVVTGCLKIAKESIFTGTNNFVSDTISSTRLNEYFGFTQKDVDGILRELDAFDRREEMKLWYDGYRFGNTDVYCPWDVMNYANALISDPLAKPSGYWKNTSDNAIIRSFIDHAGSSITKKLETLLAGGMIVQKIEEELTYDYLHSSEDNLWSILYLTGYLTKDDGAAQDVLIPAGMSALKIPNAEIREIFETTIMKWFDDSAKEWNRRALFEAVWSGDSEGLTEEMSRLLRRTISYHDYREDFYHAFLAGIFAGAGYTVESNREHGEGRSDVAVYDPVNGRAAVFEAKYAQSLQDMEKSCEAALKQMDERQYAEALEDDYDSVLCYGISFFRKRCLVRQK